MPSKTRKLTYSLAINEALHQSMERDDSVILMGQGVKSPWYVGNTAQGLLKRFGKGRVIDTPVSENAMTGAAVGASIVGMRAVVVHPRMDFMLYAFDPIVNEAANWSFMNGSRTPVPVVFWGVVNRGGEQAAQHSQSLHGMFSHVPGLKVVMPATPYDAKGLMTAAILDDGPVVFIDDRWLYNTEGDVPEEPYSVPIGKGIVRREGKDVSLIASSFMVAEALKAATILERSGVDAEVVDLRTVKPLDVPLVLASVGKTGRAVIVDSGWRTCGLAAEVAAVVAENGLGAGRHSIRRVTLPDTPAPASRSLEEGYFLDARKIVKAVMR
ncbi:MAG: alpha-ketoacid dehydrogenase subunit beta [Deltaproteobacteria bacterium]|nr:alpha-ketoacid dehydrogenase subunit beta [Deltaproteobacteria bacterium]